MTRVLIRRGEATQTLGSKRHMKTKQSKGECLVTTEAEIGVI